MRARKRFAQHFLEPAWVNKLIASSGITADDAVVEIGPGRGAITRPLAERCARLLAIEVDRDLAADLDASKPANVTVVTGDVLSLDLVPVLSEWLGAPPGPANQFRIVGNLPYNISSPILFKLIALASVTSGPRDALLMLQKEVADRLIAKVGTGDYGVLTVLTTLHADVTRVLSLPPGAFRPQPKVHSAVVRLTFRPPQVEIEDAERFVRMVRTMFTQRRKTAGNALKPFAAETGTDAAAILKGVGIDPRRRPETLELREFAALANAFSSPPSPAEAQQRDGG
ncbi:MAG TPA: 16S rRNA (adenine(1518)-N(6)/adenine(1519)-N(6))-dimethyltransferase RsmA [Vicinamibacterales bacterium]|nr:16S rRNA (adenine(1518)-N(6)/adenine(1519)-N(6))-dimethyltransferase RsmA [Vicinamibacterales bacterium]